MPPKQAHKPLSWLYKLLLEIRLEIYNYDGVFSRQPHSSVEWAHTVFYDVGHESKDYPDTPSLIVAL